MAADLELLKQIFGDQRVHITLAVVTKVEVVPSKAVARLQVKTLPEELEVIAQWSNASGLFDIPIPDDLGLIAYTDMEEAYWLKTVSHADAPIPARAASGHTVVQARKQAYLLGSKAFIGAGTIADPDQPLVLGTVQQDMWIDILADLSSFADQIKQIFDTIKTGPLAIDSKGGSCVTDPALATAITAFEAQVDSYKTQITTRKTTYIDTAASNILSGVAFTER